MGGTEPVGPAREPAAEAVAPPRLAVVLGRSADASQVCRVDAPGRVLRIWAMLRIIDRDRDTEPTADELRVEYASLLAWTIGPVTGILSQIEAASRRIARPGHARNW